MTSVAAHFDGKVFVPDAPVALEPGTAVIVTSTERPPEQTSEAFLRPLLFPGEAAASRKFLDDPETNLENY